LATEHPDRKLQTLMHCVNRETLMEAHRKQCAGKAAGIDGEVKSRYGENLEENIEGLLERMKRFSYRPQPVRRVNIPKEGGSGTRPLGVPAYEDRLVQSCMADVLNAILPIRTDPAAGRIASGQQSHRIRPQAARHPDSSRIASGRRPRNIRPQAASHPASGRAASGQPGA
jgi:hypothetical protein